MSRFLSARGAEVLRNELLVVWLPLMTAALLAWVARCGMAGRKNLFEE
jgi:hypothetical protein